MHALPYSWTMSSDDEAPAPPQVVQRRLLRRFVDAGPVLSTAASRSNVSV